MRRMALVLPAALALLAPFGEGGRSPSVLLALQMMVLGFVVLARIAAPAPRTSEGSLLTDPVRRVALPAAIGLGLAFVSSLRAACPLAAALGLRDLCLPFLLAWAATVLGAEQGGVERVVVTVVSSTTLQALAALVRFPSGGSTAAGSAFVNPNHLAAFLNLGFFLALAGLLRPGSRRLRVVWGAVAALHLATIYLLESRGAFAALFAGIGVAALLRGRALPERARRLAPGLLIAAAVAAVLVLGVRFARASDPYRWSRLSIWTAALEMIRTRPWLGFGPGMFPSVSSAFNFPSAVGPVRYGREFQGAHSAWLGLAAECGIPAAALILLTLGSAILMCLRAPRDEHARFGIGLALLTLLVQGCVEDLLVRPALTLIPALLLGAAAGRWRIRGSPGETAPARASGAVRAPSPARLAEATLALYALVVVVLLPYLAAREASAAIRLGRDGLPHMERAARLNPLQPEYRNDLAMGILNSGPLDAEGYARAVSLLDEARRLDPDDYRFVLHLARLEARGSAALFDDPTAGERALVLYREAVRLTPLDPRPRLELAAHLVEMKRPAEALQVLKEALALEPAFVRARVLEASILLDAGSPVEARAALRQAEETLADLRGYVPDSSYARDITLDARGERERLAGLLGERNAPSSPS